MIEDTPIPEGHWTTEKNARRFALIDKDVAGTISSEEIGELDRLTAELRASRILNEAVPLPYRLLREGLQRLIVDGQASPDVIREHELLGKELDCTITESEQAELCQLMAKGVALDRASA